jgi:TolB-like protein/DNA-binding winged helix-turn-helix (wHTH) protein
MAMNGQWRAANLSPMVGLRSMSLKNKKPKVKFIEVLLMGHHAKICRVSYSNFTNIVSSQAQPSFRGTLRFGAYEADLRSGELRKHGLGIALEEKPFQALVILLQHANEVVTRDELRTQLWPADIFIDFDNSLNTVIAKARRALNDSAEKPRFIETVGRGYRFMAPVESSAPDQEKRGSAATSAAPGASSVIVLDSPERATSERPCGQDPASSESAKPPTQRAGIRYRFVIATGTMVVIAALLIRLDVDGVRDRFFGRSNPGEIRSLAVLPLENLSGDKEQDYFAEGMTDELTTNLAKIRSLRVISRTTMMQYREVHKSLPQIAQELNVDAVVEGSVVRSGGTVRITAQLIDARHDHHLWAQSYEREVDQVLNVQDSVALDIATAVRAELGPEEQASLTRQRSVNPDAYEAYLRGRNKLGKQAPMPIKESLQDFQRVIDLDPLYAPAYSGLADAYSLMANYSALSPKEAFPPAKAAALKAISLDPLLSEAHSSLALVMCSYDWDWTGAEREYKRAIELSPSNAVAHHRYARFLSMLARHDEAIAEIKRARELDPLSLGIQSNVGIALYYARRYDEAILESRKTLEIDPSRAWSRVFLALSYEQKGMYPEAIQEQERVQPYFGGAPTVGLAHLYALTGRTTEARRILKELEKEGSDADWFLIAGGYAALGDKERAFNCLEKAYEKRDFFLSPLAVDPWMDPLRSDPRFYDLLHRMGLSSVTGPAKGQS